MGFPSQTCTATTALDTTPRPMAAVDTTIAAHGGWPLGTVQHHTPYPSSPSKASKRPYCSCSRFCPHSQPDHQGLLPAVAPSLVNASEGGRGHAHRGWRSSALQRVARDPGLFPGDAVPPVDAGLTCAPTPDPAGAAFGAISAGIHDVRCNRGCRGLTGRCWGWRPQRDGRGRGVDPSAGSRW